MSSQVDEEAARLIGVVTTAEAALQAAERLVEYRNRVIRDARAGGMSAVRIGQITGLSRPRVYQILNEPVTDDWYERDAFYQDLDDRWSEAFHEWDRAGREGSASEYFPLDEAVTEALPDAR